MQRIILSLTAIVTLSLLTGTQADAKGGNGGHGGSHPGSSHTSSADHAPMSNHQTFHNNHANSFNHTTHSANKTSNSFAKGHFNKNTYKQYGKQFSHGYCFNSRPYFWGNRCYLSGYGCYGYYCPSSCCYYYWCQPYQCYFPMSYCPTGQYVYPEPADSEQQASN